VENYKDLYKRIYAKVNLQKVLDSYNIIYKIYHGKRGREYLFSCPFPDHDDLTPSFSMNEETGIWQCFVCGGGDFFKFIKIVEGFQTTRESIEFIKKQLGIEHDFVVDFKYLDKSFEEMESREVNLTRKTKVEFKEIKLPESELAEKYMSIVKKRVSLKNAKRWRMRYCVNPTSKWEQKYAGRLIIPVYYENKLATFAARDMLGRADKWNEVKNYIRENKASLSDKEVQDLVTKFSFKKILYPFNSPTMYVSFNWDEAIKHREYVILVEGIFDAIRLIDYGYNVIALLSCHLSDYKANLLAKHFDTIYVCLDNDDKVNFQGKKVNPGQEAAEKIIKENREDLTIYNIVLPANRDPDECSKEEFEECFQESKNLLKKLFTFA